MMMPLTGSVKITHAPFIGKHRPFPVPIAHGSFFTPTTRKSVTRFVAPLALAKSSEPRPADYKFEPSTWIEQFLESECSSQSRSMYEEASAKNKHEELKEEVRMMLVEASKGGKQIPFEHRLGLVDSVQRLALYYHFEGEIGSILQHVYEQEEHLTCDDLYTTSLSFRLLRSEGYNIDPIGMFSKFLDEEGEFVPLLASDIEGMLALYEASYMQIHGEEILQQAQVFTTMHLKVILPNLKGNCPDWLVSQVKHALYRPIQMNYSRFEAKQYIPIYEEKGMPYGEALLKFAALDYNILQSLHIQELRQLFKWWNDTDLINKLPLMVRHRMTECYIWSLIIYSEPKYALARNWSTKLTYLLTMLDDVYDTYGTSDELELFSEAIDGWDKNLISGLPEYMQTIMFTFHNVYDEIEEKTKGRPHILYHVKQQFTNLALAYHRDSVWLRMDHVPTVKEYTNTQLLTGGLFIFPTMYYAGMGDVATEEVYNWTLDHPISSFIYASGVINRMQDDMSLNKNETTYSTLGFRTYMKAVNVSEDAAKAMVLEKIKDAFKYKNEGLLHGARSTAGIPKPVVTLMMNNARASDIYNRDGGWYGLKEEMKAATSSLIIEPVILSNE